MQMKLYYFIIFITLQSCDQEVTPVLNEKLDLSGHHLTAIPDSVFNKTNLVYLDLGSSSVTFYPPLSGLEDTNSNYISEVPSQIGKLVHLETLILNSNKLTSLPNSITDLTNLKVLDLS